MKNKVVIYLSVCLIFLFNSFAYTESTGNILLSAESLFKAMKKKDYPEIWSFLTQKSKNTIVDDVYKAFIKRGNNKYSNGQIANDFLTGGTIAKSYWDAFLENFNPDTVLEESRWEMGFIKNAESEILITYKKSEMPARLIMFKEDNVWKVGFVETFWVRK